MDHNEESLRRKFLAQHPSSINKTQQTKKIPGQEMTFDQKFRAFTAKVDNRLSDVAIALLVGGVIGWIFMIIITATLPNLNTWWFWALILAAACGTVYWYLRRSES
jgi:hypothetical protein